jgi:hypothetical protein
LTSPRKPASTYHGGKDPGSLQSGAPAAIVGIRSRHRVSEDRGITVAPTVIIAAAACIISFLALCVSVITVHQSNKSRRLDGLLRIHEFLLRDELSEARQAIREGLLELSVKEPKVRRICSSFDFAANLVRNGVVDAEPFIQYWGLALLSLEEKLKLIANQETGEGIKVSEYYKDCFWLLAETRKRRPRL